MLFHKSIFPLLRGQIGILVLQVLGGDEADFPVEPQGQLGEADMEPVVGIADCPNDGIYNELQIVQVPVFAGNDLLPVPLIHINGVDIVELLVPADGVHIGVQSITYGKAVALQSQSLPFCQRMDHLSFFAHGRNVEGDRTLVAVQVVV